MTQESQVSSENKELLRIGDEKNPLVISLNTYKEIRYFDIRRFYFDKISKSVKPTPKGISLKEEEFVALLNLLTSQGDNLISLFTDDLNSNELTLRGNRREAIASEKAKYSHGKYSYSFSSWPGPNFFISEFKKDSVEIKFNTRNNLIDKVENENINSTELLFKLISSFVKTKETLDFKSKVSIEKLIEFIETEWNNQLKL